MIISSLFNQHAHLYIIRAIDSDIWLKTDGYADGKFALGGTVRVRTWAGGGQQYDTLDALNVLNRDDREVQSCNQLSLAQSVEMQVPDIGKAQRRYITCDDNRRNYAELFRMKDGLQGMRTVNEENQWFGPVVWVKPSGNLPMTYEQSVFGGLFKSAFKQRPAYNLRVE